MNKTTKLIGAERRKAILAWLIESNQPLTGGEIASKAGVSRQVIVQDISLLKAKNQPIMATSQGYLYLTNPEITSTYQRIIACDHKPEETRQELECIVDQGITVKNVIIEHPVYGDLEASIMVSNRHDVDQFMKKVAETNAPYLLELTDGIHLHTLEADSEMKLTLAYEKLKQLGFIVKN